MQITVFGATGMVGKQVVKHALARQINVVAFGRNVQSLIDRDLGSDQLKAIKGYVFEADDVYRALKGSEAVISVLGGAFDGTDKTRSLGIKNIIDQMQGSGINRIIALGGMGVLQADESTLLLEKPDYPQEYLPVGKEHLQAYQFLNQSTLDWTFVCAPDIKDEEAQGTMQTNKNYPPSPNNYSITAGDLALFMLNELKANEFVKSRVGISN